MVVEQGCAEGREVIEYLDDGFETTCVAKVEEAETCWDGWRRGAVSVRGRVYRGW